MDNDELLALLSATAKGNKNAFANLYQNTSAKLFAISLKMLGNRAQAEEVLQIHLLRFGTMLVNIKYPKGLLCPG